jgi:hypothetical protein
MVCTGYNQHITSLLMRQELLWKLVLSDNTEIWSDYDNGKKDPWQRAKIFCNNNNKTIISLYVLIPGAVPELVYHNEEGLDNFFVIRGILKDVHDIDTTVYRYLSFGKIEEDDKIHVKKFYWPECKFGTTEEIREITPENEKLLYRKIKRCSDDCTCQSKEQI